MSYVSNCQCLHLKNSFQVKTDLRLLMRDSICYYSSPFDWKTPIGYLIPFSIQYITWILLFLNCSIILSFLSGACWILTSIAKDIGEDIQEVHRIKNVKSNRIEVKRKFFNIITFHSDAKQLSIRNRSFFFIPYLNRNIIDFRQVGQRFFIYLRDHHHGLLSLEPFDHKQYALSHPS